MTLSNSLKILVHMGQRYNLWLNDELNFDEDDEDIKLRDETAHLSKLRKKVAETQAHISYRLLHSLIKGICFYVVPQKVQNHLEGEARRAV